MTIRGGNTNTVVVGAGVIGLSIAFRLAKAGNSVVLIDRAEPGSGCSSGNAGHIATEQVFPLASPSTVLHAAQYLFGKNAPLSIRPAYAARIAPWLARFTWASRPDAFRRGTEALCSLQSPAMDSLQLLLRDAGIESQLHRRGHLIVVEAESSKRAAMAKFEMFRAHDIDAEWVGAERVAEIAPELKRDVAGGVFVRDTGHVGDPLSVCQGLHAAFLGAGGLFVGDEVLDIRRGRDFELKLRNATLHADTVVVAAGAWSRPLAAQLGCPLPLDTERGYHINADGWRGSFDVAIASFDRNTIITPLDGGLRITGFVEFGGLDLPQSRKRLETLQRHLRELLPEADFPVLNEWMGFRPSLPDYLPAIGQVPGQPGAIFAFGHQHLGLTFAGVTADAVLALCVGDEPPVDLTPFRVDRFR